MVAGVGRALESLANFTFDEPTLAALEGVVDQPTVEWLSQYRFRGNIWGYPEGELYFPHSPVLIVEGTFGEAVLLETLLLSIYNHDGAIASAASRITWAAGERPCIEMGSRRTHEAAAVAAARAAYVAGFTSSSNLAARQRYGVPTTGTSAHSFTLLHDSEADAFTAQLNSLGTDTTLLVDTYDVTAAVELAVELAGPKLGAIRLDSGDLGLMARQVRTQLDALGATETKIVVTSDLDEYAIAGLTAAPVDAYGVGTQVVVGSGHPTCGFVYKLVARATETSDELVSVAKASAGKASIGGRKFAYRTLSDGVATAETISVGQPPIGDTDSRELLVPLVVDGEIVGQEPLDAARQRHLRVREELPLRARKLQRGEPAIPTVFA